MLKLKLSHECLILYLYIKNAYKVADINNHN
jgi:hypothetical protein